MTLAAFAHKFLAFTDLHITSAGEKIIGLDPLERFTQGLTHALELHGDADALLLLGDLTHDGTSDQFARLKAALGPVSLPVIHLLGNHDNRTQFRATFPQARVTPSGFVQTWQRYEHVTVITLDTLDEAADPPHSGRLCADRLNWLDSTLSEAGDTPVLLALHHPPGPTGFTGMDRIALQEPGALIQRLKAHPSPVQIIAGHIHRTISGHVAGLPISIFKSTCHQMPMMLGKSGSAHSIDEPGAYGIVLAGPDGIAVHSEDFAIAQTARLRRDPASA